jgi:hypothetical protein
VVLNTGRKAVMVPGTWRLLAASGGPDRPVTSASFEDIVTDPIVPADCCVWLEAT